MLSLIWRSSSTSVPLERFWPLAGFELAEPYRRGDSGLLGRILDANGFLITIPIVPENSADAVEAAMLGFIRDRHESVSNLRQNPAIKSEFDLLVTVGSSDAFGRTVSFSPELLNELRRSNVFLTVTCVPATD